MWEFMIIFAISGSLYLQWHFFRLGWQLLSFLWEQQRKMFFSARWILNPLLMQVNTLAAEKLYSLAGDWACLGPDTLLFDICCGTGTIGLTLAHRVGMVIITTLWSSFFLIILFLTYYHYTSKLIIQCVMGSILQSLGSNDYDLKITLVDIKLVFIWNWVNFCQTDLCELPADFSKFLLSFPMPEPDFVVNYARWLALKWMLLQYLMLTGMLKLMA